jgi:hypothetical protein
MSILIRATNWKVRESGFNFCLAKTFVFVRQALQPTVFLKIKNRDFLSGG